MSTISGGIGPKLPIQDISPKSAPAPVVDTKTTTTTTITAPTTISSEGHDVSDGVKSQSSKQMSSVSSVLGSSSKVMPTETTSKSTPTSKLGLKDSLIKLKAAFSKVTTTFSSLINSVSMSFDKETKTFSLDSSGSQILAQKHNPDASFKDKVIDGMFRKFIDSEYTMKNYETLDLIKELSDLDPESPDFDTKFIELHDTYLAVNSSEELNLGGILRDKLADAKTRLLAAKEAFAADPSEANQAELIQAKTDCIEGLAGTQLEVGRLVNDTKGRFSETAKDLGMILEHGLSSTKKSVKKALYIARLIEDVEAQHTERMQTMSKDIKELEAKIAKLSPDSEELPGLQRTLELDKGRLADEPTKLRGKIESRIKLFETRLKDYEAVKKSLTS